MCEVSVQDTGAAEYRWELNTAALPNASGQRRALNRCGWLGGGRRAGGGGAGGGDHSR